MSLDDVDFILHHFGDVETNRYSEHESLKNREEAIDFYYRFIECGKKTQFRLGIILKEKGKLSTKSIPNIKRWLKAEMDKKEDVFLTSQQTVDLGLADEVFNYDWKSLTKYL